jgi:hypothetical protein
LYTFVVNKFGRAAKSAIVSVKAMSWFPSITFVKFICCRIEIALEHEGVETSERTVPSHISPVKVVMKLVFFAIAYIAAYNTPASP